MIKIIVCTKCLIIMPGPIRQQKNERAFPGRGRAAGLSLGIQLMLQRAMLDGIAPVTLTGRIAEGAKHKKPRFYWGIEVCQPKFRLRWLSDRHISLSARASWLTSRPN